MTDQTTYIRDAKPDTLQQIKQTHLLKAIGNVDIQKRYTKNSNRIFCK